MAFKYVLLSLCALLGATRAGLVASPIAYAAAPVIAKVAQPHFDAVGTTQQNVVRSFGGTVSTYSKNVVTPYSSFSKSDSRTTNNVYTPALAKTVYSAPVVTKSFYTAEAPVAYAKSYATPVITKSYAAPAVHYAAPAPVAYTKSYAAPAVHYAAPAPVAYAKTYSPAVYAAPVVTKSYAPAVYSAPVAAPAVYAAAPAAYVKYSPAVAVAHVSFDGMGAHWGY